VKREVAANRLFQSALMFQAVFNQKNGENGHSYMLHNTRIKAAKRKQRNLGAWNV